jgi:hypothetical protein
MGAFPALRAGNRAIRSNFCFAKIPLLSLARPPVETVSRAANHLACAASHTRYPVPSQGNGIYFFSVTIPLKIACSEKKITSKSNKSKKEGKKRPENKNLFDFLDFAVKISSKTWSFPGT